MNSTTFRDGSVTREFFSSSDVRNIQAALTKTHKRDIGNSKVVEIRQVTKIGRNQSCPCGSGKKFKKCCLALAVPV